MAAALLQAVPVPSRFRRARAPPGLAAMGQRKYRQSLKVTIVVLSYYDIVVHESRKHDMICTETCFCYKTLACVEAKACPRKSGFFRSDWMSRQHL